MVLIHLHHCCHHDYCHYNADTVAVLAEVSSVIGGFHRAFGVSRRRHQPSSCRCYTAAGVVVAAGVAAAAAAAAGVVVDGVVVAAGVVDGVAAAGVFVAAGDGSQ